MFKKIMLISSIIIMFNPPLMASGFQQTIIYDPADTAFTIGIWYPSSQTAPTKINTPFRQKLALNAPLQTGHYPLIVMSHGYGGWLGSHAATAKAVSDAGYIVVAPTHTGNNYQDESYPPSRWMQDRPRHISLTLDYMTKQWPDRQQLDTKKIGIFGFSAGGYTALVSSGAIPDIREIQRYCADRNIPLTETVCHLGIRSDTNLSHHNFSNALSDSRITAAVVAAPALGFGFTKESLENIHIPIQIWAAQNDQNVPFVSNIQPLENMLSSNAEFITIDHAGHFIFIPPCNPELSTANPAVWKMVCTDDPKINRTSFHNDFNRQLISFFAKQL
ncbi:alpha/beta hydrolase family protein [Aliamphritea ceti]|uniref:alpha/beta hydrolase family protein n=1 Tax=Aliamphritea ceti TaxID=1524258 RepID=UPI0021C39C97|nr:dienelactone hydrolase family protein [Aliamphritea ceti]